MITVLTLFIEAKYDPSPKWEGVYGATFALDCLAFIVLASIFTQ